MAKTKEEERWLKEGAQRHRTNVNLAKQKAPAKSGSNANLMKGFYTPAEKPKRAIEKNEALNAVKRAAKMKNTGYTMKQLTDKLTPEMRSGITNSVKERRKKQAESAKEKLSSAKDRRSRAAYRQELRDALYPLTRQERNMSWNDRDNLQDMKSLWSVQQELKERGYTYNVKEIQDSAHRAAEWIRARYGFSGGESGADNILPELSWEDENLTTPEGKRYLRSMKRIYEMAKEDGDQDLMDKAHKGAGEIRNLDGFWDPEKMRAYRDRKPDYQFYDAHGRPRYTPSEWDAETQKNFLPAIGNSVAGSLRAFRETAIQALRNNADNRDNNAYNSAKRNMEIAKQMMAQAKTPEEKEEWQKFLDESTELASSSKIDTPVSKDSPGMKQMERANQQAQRVVEGMDTAVGKRVAEAVLSIGQMAPALATGLVNPALPMVVMGVQAAGSKAYDLAQRGVGASEALMRGTAAGVIEGLTEKIPVGNLLKILDAAGGGRLLKNLLKQAGIEATEESVSYTLN